MNNFDKKFVLLVFLCVWLTLLLVMAEAGVSNSKEMPAEKSSETLSQNRKPVCFADMCLGQAIQTVIVKWKPGRMIATNVPAKLFLSKYAPDLTAPEIEFLAPYFDVGGFDEKVVEFFKKRKPVFCQDTGLVGEFVSPSGYPTKVTIRYDLDQTWRITTITRYYKQVDQHEQASIMEQLQKTYPDLQDEGVLRISHFKTSGDFVITFLHPVWLPSNEAGPYLRWGEGFESILEEQLNMRIHNVRLGTVIGKQEKCKKETLLH